MRISPVPKATSVAPEVPPEIVRNRVLERLSGSERAAVWALGTQVEFAAGTEVLKSNETFTTIYFPESAVFSLFTELRDGRSVESGTVGNEGFVGLPVFLGADSSLQRVWVQVPGRACAVSAQDFLNVIPSLPQLSKLLRAYSLAYMIQAAVTAACNSQHPVSKRTARWLIMTHDRVGAREIKITHDLLAYMLGVRRPSVTFAQAFLRRQGLIDYSRGRVRVKNLKGLESASCGCHEIVREEFAKVLAFPRAD